MVGVIFDNPSARDRLKHIIKCDIFLGHFLLCMLRDTYILCCSLSLYLNKYRPEIVRVMHHAKLRSGAGG